MIKLRQDEFKEIGTLTADILIALVESEMDFEKSKAIIDAVIALANYIDNGNGSIMVQVALIIASKIEELEEQR